MWSVGCVLGEMLRGSVVFGERHTTGQIQRLVNLLGLPKKEILDKISDSKIRAFLKESRRKMVPIHFSAFFPGTDP